MIPKSGDTYIEIPLTFDVRPNIKTVSRVKIYTVMLFLIVFFLASLCLCFFMGFMGVFVGIALTFLVAYFLRMSILREKYFMSKYKEFEETKGVFEYKTFWNIFDIDEAKPYINHFADGRKALFIALPKDVILGKGEDSEYLHYEGVTAAYGALSKNGISAIHIDYMDVVGKDSRLQKLFESLDKTKDPNLKRLLYSVFNHIRNIMSEEIASYDVYCFYTYSSEELFLSSLDMVVAGLHRANYLGHLLLPKEEVAELVKAIFNLGDFQIKQMCESVLEDNGSTNFLRLIWTETNGERKVINKTKQELDAERRTQEAEKAVKVKKKRAADNEELDL